MSFRHLLSAGCLLASWAAWAQAPVQVQDPWARASVPGQQASGAFMRLTAQENLRLVGVSTPASAVAEVHEMTMEGDIMRMRAIDALDLPAGQTVELRPGGYHLMFMQLTAPLQEGSNIAVTLQFQDAQGQPSELQLQVPVKRLTQPAGAAHQPGHPGHGMQH